MLEKLRQYGVIPVIAADTVDKGVAVCDALMEGGLPVAEITFRTEAAADIIHTVSQRFPEMYVGAGTVLKPKDAERAKNAGATFAVAPGCNPEVVTKANDIQLPFFPGVWTPSDVETALALECRCLKFFPAEAAGGVKVLKALSGPYSHLGIQFCPTGGIRPENMKDYLNLPNVPVVGGTWLAPKQLQEEGNWQKITKMAAEAVSCAQA